jgi:hypothetical protein
MSSMVRVLAAPLTVVVGVVVGGVVDPVAEVREDWDVIT